MNQALLVNYIVNVTIYNCSNPLYYSSNDTKIVILDSKLTENQGSPSNIEFMEDQHNMADGGSVACLEAFNMSKAYSNYFF